MEFNPSNDIVKLCIRGMEMEDQENSDEAVEFFLECWTKASNDF